MAGAQATTPETPAAPAPPDTLATRRDISERMTTAVWVNGKGPFQFLVDTGANRSGISRELALALGLPPGPSVRAHGIASAYMADTVEIQDFRIGSRRIPLKDAPVFARADLGVDGLIGVDMLKNREVVIDFLADKLEILAQGSTRGLYSNMGPLSGGVAVEAHQRFGQLTIVDAYAGRARMICFIDTGAQQSVGNTALRLAVQARQRADEIIQADTLIHGATGQTVPGKMALVPSMKIGGIAFTRFAMAFADLHTFELWGLADKPAMLIGMDLLRLFDTVTIDFGGKEVWFGAATSNPRR